jgi:hypothetical protein
MRKIADVIDVLAAVLGGLACLGTSIYLIAQGVVLQSFLLLFVLVSCVFYLVVRLRNQDQIYTLFKRPMGINSSVILEAGFYFSLGISFLIILNRPELYSRPVSYFLLNGLLGALIGLQIVSRADRKSAIIFQIILWGMYIRWVQLAMFPGHIWFDPWFHEKFVVELIQGAHIPEAPELQIYSHLPIYHLFIGTVMLITGGDFKFANMAVFIPVEVILQGVSIYLISVRFIPSRQVAALALFFVTIGDTIIAYGISTTPNAFAVAIIPMLLYSIFLGRANKSVALIVFSVALMILLILTHTIASMAFMLVLAIFWLGSKLFHILYAGKLLKDETVTLFTVLFFLVSMLTYWMYASGHFVLLVLVFRWVFDTSFFTPPPPEQVIAYSSQVPVLEILLDRSGYFLFYSLAVLGFLHVLRRRYTNLYAFSICIIGVLLTSIGFVGSALNAYVQPGRWFFMSQIFMSIPAGIGIMLVVSVLKPKKWVVVVLTGLLAVLMTSSSVVNSDTPLFSSSRYFRHGFTQSEIESMSTIADVYGKLNMLADQHAYAYLANKEEMAAKEFTEQLSTRDFSDSRRSFILVREYIVNNIFYTRGLLWKLDYDLPKNLESQGFSRVYDSGSLFGYYYLPDGNQ